MKRVMREGTKEERESGYESETPGQRQKGSTRSTVQPRWPKPIRGEATSSVGLFEADYWTVRLWLTIKSHKADPLLCH